MSAKAFDSDSDAAYPKTEGAFRTAGDVVPIRGDNTTATAIANAYISQANYNLRQKYGYPQPNAQIIKFPDKPQ